MGVLGENSLGKTEEDPLSGWGLIASDEDIRSWAQVHKAVERELAGQVASYGSLPSTLEAREWLEDENTQAFGTLTAHGESWFDATGLPLLWNFGAIEGAVPTWLIEDMNENAAKGWQLDKDLEDEKKIAIAQKASREAQRVADLARQAGASEAAQAAADKAAASAKKSAAEQALARAKDQVTNLQREAGKLTFRDKLAAGGFLVALIGLGLRVMVARKNG